MPKLNKITCSVELGPSNTKLREYGTRYSDGHVETFIAVPETDLPFSIHLISEGYIAPGLAFFVFMDGEYQCNRNRTELKLRTDGIEASAYETEFRVRQKEEKTTTGTFVVRDWTFAKLNRVAADKAPSLNPRFTSNIGTIEVIVLRCKAAFDELPPSKIVSHDAKHTDNKKDQAQNTRAAKRSEVADQRISAPASELGGLFGLFDGTWDDINSSEAENQSPLQGGNLDGVRDPPGVVINQWSSRERDSKQEDKHLGVQGEPRDAHDRSWRPAGGDMNARNGWQTRIQNDAPMQQPAYGQSRAGQNNLSNRKYAECERLAATLDGLQRSLEDYLLSNQGNANTDVEEARQDLSTIQQLKGALQGPTGSSAFLEWMKEALLDVEVMRQHTEALGKHFIHKDFTDTLQKLAQQQMDTIRDARLKRDYGATLEGCRELSLIFDRRIRVLESYLKEMGRPDAVSLSALQERLTSVQRERANIDAVARDIERCKTGGGGFDRRPSAQPARQHWADGPQNSFGGMQDQNKLGHPENHNGGKSGWQQVGVGSWAPNRPGTGRSEHHRGEVGDAKWREDNHDEQNHRKSGWWEHSDKGSNRNDGARQLSNQAGNNRENGRDGGWDQNKDQNASKSGSQKTIEHFGGNDNKSQNGQSEWPGNNNDNDGRNDKISNRSKSKNKSKSTHWNNSDRGRSEHASQKPASNNGGWAKAASDSRRSKSRSSQGRSRGSDAGQDCIKPYWAEWNKPFSRNANPDTEIKRSIDPRQVYQYPAEPLPAIAENKAKDTSHAIQLSRGADYSHKCRKPVYIDSMEAPYAVFSFKYRSKDVLEQILKCKIDDSDVERIQEQAERAKLASLPKQKLVDELMSRRKGTNGSGNRSTSPNKAQSTSWKNEGAKSTANSNAWGEQDDGKGAWDANSNRSRRSSHHSDRKSKSSKKDGFGGSWDNNKITNSNAGAWKEEGDGGNMW